jgi:hypothetical protein
LGFSCQLPAQFSEPTDNSIVPCLNSWLGSLIASLSRTVSPVALGFSDPDDGIHKAPLGDDRANVRRASPPGFFPTVFHSSYQRTMARPDLNDFGSDTSTTSGANYTIIPKMSSLPASI